MLCGTDPFPTDFRAKKYKLDKHSISKVRSSKKEHNVVKIKLNTILGRFCSNNEELASVCVR